MNALQKRALREVSQKLRLLEEEIKSLYVWKPEELTSDHSLKVSATSLKAKDLKDWVEDILNNKP